MSGLPETSAFILAGGKSTRMGADKALMEFRGCVLLERALDLARSVTARVSVVGDPAKYSSFAPVIEDIFPECGPLGGIHAALRSSQSELNLILAVDTPFLTAEFLKYLIEKATSSDALVTVPRAARGWQPLCAVYRCEFADLAETSLHSGRYRIDALFDPVRTRVIAEQELQAMGFALDMFLNLNTRQDLTETSR